MQLIKIKPVLVRVFPEQKYAHYLYVNAINVQLVDKGVIAITQLCDENGITITEQLPIVLSNDEIANWTTTDNELIDIIINKLQLEKE